MTLADSCTFNFVRGMIAALLLTFLIVPASAQNAAPITVGGIEIMGLPDDWSHHHVVFSNPGTEREALENATYDDWLKVVNDPRYVIQQLKRGAPAQGPAAEDVARIEGAAQGNDFGDAGDPLRLQRGPPPPRRGGLHRDWSMGLGNLGKVGAGQYPAKFSFSILTVNCGTDYVVYNTGLAGSATQATVVAYNNLYVTTCSGSVPSTYWAYNTGGTATLSPILSYAGDQVAYIQTVGTTASLVLLKSATPGGTVVAPGSINSVSNASYRTCPTLPCYTTITLNGSPNDTNSPPYVDYYHDIMYVGDNSGKLHQFTGVFYGTPAETLTGVGGWPATAGTAVLTGPVYESVSTNVFVGNASGVLYRVTTTGTIAATASGSLSAAGSTGIVDAPLVDSTPAAPKVYAFVGDPDSAIQFATNFVSGTSGISEPMGSSSTSTILYIGAFDDAHYAGPGTTGNLYVCGYHSTGTTPRLFQIVMNSGFTGVVNTITTDPASAAATCSPVTEISNSSNAATTLRAAITTTTSTSIPVTSGTGFTNGDYIRIDSETLLITAGGGTTTLTASRGQLGTTAATHLIGAVVADIGLHDWIFLSVTAGGAAGGSPACTGACILQLQRPGHADCGHRRSGRARGRKRGYH